MSSKPLKLFIFCCLIGSGGNILAQSPSTPLQRLSDLLQSYRSQQLPDSGYLKAVDSLAPLLLTADSLPERLTVYRDIAFGNPRWGIYRAHYYTYLAAHYSDKNQFGSAIYYAEKNNQERIAIGEFKPDGLSHSDLFAITIYSNNHDYARVLARYASLRPALEKIPAAVRAGSVSADDLAVGLMIGNAVVYAACKARDSVVAVEAAAIGDSMTAALGGSMTAAIGGSMTAGNRAGVAAAVGSPSAKYGARVVEFYYLDHLSDFERERFLHHDVQASRFLNLSIGEVAARGFPPGLQPAYREFTLTEAFDFHFSQNRTDSARYYLGLVRTLSQQGVQFSQLDPDFFPASDSRLQAREGNYRQAYEELLRGYQIRDSAFYAVSADKDNNLYALTAAENVRSELVRTREERERARRYTAYLFSLLGLLLLGGFGGFMAYRSRQRQRLLNVQLNLARNFHDEIGPMLLFANALAKKELEERPSPGLAELKVRTMQIMEAVRGIAHDLKSDRLHTVESFGKEVNSLLEKIRETTGISFEFRPPSGGRVLSHWQYMHLTKMVNELISNSIKHAGCSKIALLIRVAERVLHLSYSDDGRGMEPGSFTAGIGLGNIKERVCQLKGEFQLRNAWPEGYSIDISIPFV
jgi:signal transduction histidine kinase